MPVIGLTAIPRFQEIIQACSLEHDLNIFTHGQHTEIGEKGINLSGMSHSDIPLLSYRLP